MVSQRRQWGKRSSKSSNISLCVHENYFFFSPSLSPSPSIPIRRTLFTFFLFVFYLCLHIFWPGYITSLIVLLFFSLLHLCCCFIKLDRENCPIYDYIPTWYHEFIHNMQSVLSLSLDISFYRFLIKILVFFTLFLATSKIGNSLKLLQQQQHTRESVNFS